VARGRSLKTLRDVGGPADGVLLSAIQSLFSAREPDDIRAAVARTAWLVSRYDGFALHEFQENGDLHVTLRHGERTTATLAVEAVLCSRVSATRRTAGTLDRLGGAQEQDVVDAYVAGNRLCVVRPLVADDEPVGLLALHYDGRIALEAGEFDALRRLCSCAAVALSNVRRREILSRFAYSDALTGLANRRHLEAEFKRLSGSKLSLLLIDFDGLKSVNDELGYDSGDALIREVAAALAAAVLPGETVVRFGGDEFVLLMPDRDADYARARADELTELLDRVTVPPGIARLFRGASVGCATARADDEPGEVLQHAAAVMRSRKRRRNTDRVARGADGASGTVAAASRTAPTSWVDPT
jgi:diguanylate cyclase (GGDEF)-like protein